MTASIEPKRLVRRSRRGLATLVLISVAIVGSGASSVSQTTLSCSAQETLTIARDIMQQRAHLRPFIYSTMGFMPGLDNTTGFRDIVTVSTDDMGVSCKVTAFDIETGSRLGDFKYYVGQTQRKNSYSGPTHRGLPYVTVYFDD